MNTLLLLLALSADPSWEARYDAAEDFEAENQYGKAEEQYRLALDEIKKAGNDADERSYALRWLGNNLSKQGRYEEAAKAHQLSRQVRRKAGLDTCEFANGLADAWLYLGRYEDAEYLLKSELPTLAERSGFMTGVMATTLNNLAAALAYQNLNTEAERAYRQSMAIVKQVDGEESVGVARALDNLGGVLLSRGKEDEAVSMRRESVRLYKKVLGNDVPETALAMNNLAATLPPTERKEQLALYKEALSIQRKAFGEEHPALATTYANLGFVAAEDGKLEEAKAYTEKALKIRKAKLGEDHPLTFDVEDQLADIEDQIAEAKAPRRKPAFKKHK